MTGPRFIDLTGQKFGMVNVLAFVEESGGSNKQKMWRCRCDCGVEKIIYGSTLRGGIKSCGCLKTTTHGHTRTRTYRSWEAMKYRCNNPNSTAYSRYGGRGIKVCDRWMESYENFLADMGICPNDRTLERVDNNKGYSPENCKWATKYEQDRNKRSSIKIEANGAIFNLKDAATMYGLHPSLIKQRAKSRHYQLQEAFNELILERGLRPEYRAR